MKAQRQCEAINIKFGRIHDLSAEKELARGEEANQTWRRQYLSRLLFSHVTRGSTEALKAPSQGGAGVAGRPLGSAPRAGSAGRGGRAEKAAPGTWTRRSPAGPGREAHVPSADGAVLGTEGPSV